MDVRELRLGNITNKGYVTGLPMGCSHSDWQINCDYSDYKLDDIKPVPLTEDWLLKFGFKDGYLILDEQQIYINIEFEIFNLFGADSVTSGHTFSGTIKHVHSLQNLYFALTGTELTIK